MRTLYKLILIFLLWLTEKPLSHAQVDNVEIGLNLPAYGVNIKANFPGNGGWARGFRLSNQDGTENFIQLGAYGTRVNGQSSQFYSFLGKTYNDTYLVFLPNGDIGIGTTQPKEKLAVNGNIRAKEIKVEATNWPDYVFKPDYTLMPLKEVEQHIKTHGHLPDVPKAEQIEQEGLSVSEMNKLMMKKIEELTLHLIEKEKEIHELKSLRKEVEQLQKLIIKQK